MKTWYTIQALAADGSAATGDAAPARASISIFDEIGGWGITAKQFIADFAALPDNIPIDLNIHSPGGEVFEALAMYHVLASARERLTATVVGLAASAATLPLLAAGKRVAPANAYIMVHNPMSFSRGDAQEMREMAALLDKITGSLANIYASNTGKAHADIIDMMNAETWLDGTAAANAGFIHEVTDAVPVAAHLSAPQAARFAHVPKALLAPAVPPPADHLPDATKMVPPMPADAIASACLAAGEPALSPLLIRAALDADSVARRLQEANDIRALAAAAGRAEEAHALILAGSSIAHARQHLLQARAAELPAIRNQSPSDAPAPDADKAALNQRLDFRTIYSRRNKAVPAASLPV